MLQTVHVRLPPPFNNLHLDLPSDSTLASIPLPDALRSSSIYFRTVCSGALPFSTPLSTLRHDSNHPIDLHLGVRMLGGKGGFGANLRAAGGRMNMKKDANNVDACRDLSGRRLSTIKEAKRQAELLEAAPALRAAAKAADKAKLEALERALGISSAEATEIMNLPADAEDNGEGSSRPTASGSSKRLNEVDIEEIARKKYKFEDNKFFEESREINENVRSAVAAGLLKKKKKPKTDGTAATAGATSSSDGKGKGVGKGKGPVSAAVDKDKVAMPPPSVSKTAAVA